MRLTLFFFSAVLGLTIGSAYAEKSFSFQDVPGQQLAGRQDGEHGHQGDEHRQDGEHGHQGAEHRHEGNDDHHVGGGGGSGGGGHGPSGNSRINPGGGGGRGHNK